MEEGRLTNRQSMHVGAYAVALDVNHLCILKSLFGHLFASILDRMQLTNRDVSVTWGPMNCDLERTWCEKPLIGEIRQRNECTRIPILSNTKGLVKSVGLSGSTSLLGGNATCSHHTMYADDVVYLRSRNCPFTETSW